MNQLVSKCVLLAGRHHGLSEAIRGLLESTFETVVMVADEKSLIETASKLQPAIAVIDLSICRADCLPCLKRLRSLCGELKLILIGAHDEPSVSRAVLDAGADAYIVKRNLSTELLPMIDTLMARQATEHPRLPIPRAGSNPPEDPA